MTDLVQESYLRRLDWRGVHWQNRAHFFATAAGMMRRALVDAARARRALKRGEGIEAVPLDEADVPGAALRVDTLALDEALEAAPADHDIWTLTLGADRRGLVAGVRGSILARWTAGDIDRGGQVPANLLHRKGAFRL